jgi:hypothetical protein
MHFTNSAARAGFIISSTISVKEIVVDLNVMLMVLLEHASALTILLINPCVVCHNIILVGEAMRMMDRGECFLQGIF